MTQEEKAKAYDEALERAKSMYGGLPTDNATLEYIFPELAESEDERIRTALCDIVRDMPYMKTELRAHGLTVEKTIAYLEKQKEQKPAEWSEEDEHRLSDAIYFLESAKSHYADTSEIEKTIEWLKSLRPQTHWKPTEEQMEALDNARFCKSYDRSELDLLYEQLKKLM